MNTKAELIKLIDYYLDFEGYDNWYDYFIGKSIFTKDYLDNNIMTVGINCIYYTSTTFTNKFKYDYDKNSKQTPSIFIHKSEIYECLKEHIKIKGNNVNVYTLTAFYLSLLLSNDCIIGICSPRVNNYCSIVKDYYANLKEIEYKEKLEKKQIDFNNKLKEQKEKYNKIIKTQQYLLLGAIVFILIKDCIY